MSMPLQQKLAIGKYILSRRLRGEEKYALVLELEPLLQCNLACAGCGKISHPTDILRRRLSVEDCIRAVDECGAPVVSIAGGEPLVHEQMPQIVQALIDRGKFIFLCTNALLLKKKIDLFKPHVQFAWMIHLDGLKEHHDQAVSREGVFEIAIEAIKLAKARGFRVFTNTTFFDRDDADSIRSVLDYLNDELKVDMMQISPAYAYEKAPDQEHFLGVERTREIFREAFSGGNRDRWRLNHSPVYLDFLEGKTDFECTPWGIPCYTVFGWQRPCYLMSQEPYAQTYRELIEETDWSKYGRGKHPSCANCMAHCGYEPTAVLKTMSSVKETLRAALAN
ncbi:MAG: adenosyl-hopene transferase HpnH [Candidatus Eremiobacteraeota bacterium]|nr:adenosyl-hopene transferase HpnH [Candidatus Eremiobacteraeota bacterium]